MEMWKDIVGYEGYYQVSNCGNVRSVDRIDSVGRKRKGRVLKPSKTNGYLGVNLSKNSVVKFVRVHVMVAETFLIKVEGLEINHIDANKENNSSINLEWITHKKNIEHSYILGRRKRAIPRVPKMTHLTVKEIEEIKDIIKYKVYKQIELAKMYGVSNATITFIKQGKKVR